MNRSSRSILSSLVFLAGSCLLFQNCGSNGFEGASLPFEQASVVARNYFEKADISWSMMGELPESNSYGRTMRWRDSANSGVNLYPQLRTNSQNLNLDKSPTLVKDGAFSFLKFDTDESLAPSVADVSQLLGDRFTVVMVLKNFKIPTVDAKVLRIFNFYPANGDVAGQLGIDIALDPEKDDILFSVYSYMDGNNVSLNQFHLPKSDANTTLALAIRYSKDATDIGIAVNGTIISGKKIITGTPGQLGKMTRQLVLHSFEGAFGSQGGFSLGEFLVFRREIPQHELAFVSSTFACRWGLTEHCTSGTFNPTPSPTPVESEGAALYKASCSDCHGGLATSAKRNVDLSRLDNAIKSNSDMKIRSNLVNLTSDQRQKIVEALSK